MSKKVLVFGAGVLGSLYALMLQKAGNDVTVVARGSRYDDISGQMNWRRFDNEVSFTH